MRCALSHRTLSRRPPAHRVPDHTIAPRIALSRPDRAVRAPHCARHHHTRYTWGLTVTRRNRTSSIAPRIEHPGLSRPRCRTIFCRTIFWECRLCAACLGLVLVVL